MVNEMEQNIVHVDVLVSERIVDPDEDENVGVVDDYAHMIVNVLEIVEIDDS